jgi:outer membrane protein
MQRSHISRYLLLMVCLSVLLPQPAISFDLFDTEQSVKSEGFAATGDAANCDRTRINQPLTLSDVVDLALCNNPLTRSLWISARIQAANVGVNMAAYLPTLSAQGSISKDRTSSAGLSSTSTTRSVGLTASYLLFDFGGRAGSLENAKQLLIAANATRDATLQNNYLSAVQFYYSLLSARANVQALQVAETSARESLAAAQARYDAGVATPADKLQAQTALSQATLNLVTAKGAERNAQGALANIMGFDASQPFDLAPVAGTSPNPAVEQDIGKLIDEARHDRPDLAAADAQIKAAEAQLEATRATGLPTVTLGASSNSVRTRGSPVANGSSINLTLNVPLFTGMSNTYQNRAAELQIENQKASRDLLANKIALDVWNAYQTLLTDSQALRTATDLVASAEQSEAMTLGRYKAGVGNILDVLTAQSTLASARQQKIAALYNFLASRVALAQSIGQLDMTRSGDDLIGN